MKLRFWIPLFSSAIATLAVVPAGRAKSTKQISQETMPGVVQVIAADFRGDRLVPVASGSGSILTPDGAVLTNHHVIYNKDAAKLFDVAAIALLKAYDEPPEITCLASPKNGVLRPELDLALLKCEVDLEGKPFRAASWPTVPVGNSEDLIPGSPVLIFGYPGVGGPTINMTSGHVSGFLGKEGGAGKFWIKTDAAIAHGNSGGTAVDDEGLLVGIPTAVRPGEADSGERVGLLRPVALASDLIALAKGGWRPGGGTTTRAPTTVDDPDTDSPSTGNGGDGGDLGNVDSGECPLQKGVMVSGRVIATDNNKPVVGAFVVILKPGVKRADIEDDYSNIAESHLTYAVSNENGRWFAPCPIHRDKKFSVIVVADGFVELAGDDVLSTVGASDRFEPWSGVIRLERK